MRYRKDRDQFVDRPPWMARVTFLSSGNSSIYFIGLMSVILGLAVLCGFSNPVTLLKELPDLFYTIWGVALFMAGSAVMVGIHKREILLEKAGARLLSLAILTYGLWSVIVITPQRSVFTMVMSTILIFTIEQRVSVINILLYGNELAKHLLKQTEEVQEILSEIEKDDTL